MSRTGAPAIASAAARLTAVVVLPTPPFWFATARTSGLMVIAPRMVMSSQSRHDAVIACFAANRNGRLDRSSTKPGVNPAKPLQDMRKQRLIGFIAGRRQHVQSARFEHRHGIANDDSAQIFGRR